MSKQIIPKDSLFLVTGANGLIGSHIADQLLKHGYRVRGTVRAPEKQQWLVELFEKQYGQGRFELVKVEDFTQPGAFDEAVKGVAGFAHVAADLSFLSDPNKIVTPAIKSTEHALQAAESEPGLKSFVLTSSSTAATKPYPNKKFHVDANTWNEADVQDAWRDPPYEPSRSWAVYGASKKQSEEAAWKFVRERKPHFTFNSILPNANYGPILDPKNQHGSTAGWITGAIKGDFDKLKSIPPQYFVDVRDTALLHVAALTDLSIANERIFAFAETWSWNRILAILRSIRPDLQISADIDDNSQDLSTVANERAEAILQEKFGKGWTKLEDSLKENVKAL